MAAAAARGPLSSALGQWGFLGLAGFSILPPLDVILAKSQSILTLLTTAAGTAVSTPAAQQFIIHNQPAAPSILSTTTLKLTLTALSLWGSFALLSTLLPQQLQNYLPVTKAFFSSTVATLSRGLIAVRDRLSEEIQGVEDKVDAVSGKQDETLTELGAARRDIDAVNESVAGIAGDLDEVRAALSVAERRGTYVARGVRLLVACVGGLLPGGEMKGELKKFMGVDGWEGEEVVKATVVEDEVAEVTARETRDPETTNATTPVKRKVLTGGGELDEVKNLLFMGGFGGEVVSP